MEKSFFKKCWENKRLHALMVLIIWIVVLGGLMGIFYLIDIVNPKQEQNQEEKIKEDENNENDEVETIFSYEEKLNKLAASDYKFTYHITKNKEKIIFEGIKEDNTINGYKQESTGIIKYKIEKEQIYQILVDKEIPITNLYEEIDASLLDLNYIIGILNQIPKNDVIITNEELRTIYNYNLTQDEEELEITVTESEKSIESIRISRNNETYELIYKEK